jgi:hypothetical protein
MVWVINHNGDIGNGDEVCMLRPPEYSSVNGVIGRAPLGIRYKKMGSRYMVGTPWYYIPKWNTRKRSLHFA